MNTLFESSFGIPTVISQVWLTGGNGRGSTNTVIRRFTTTVINTGPDITFADSATNGASFTINSNGVYAISYTDSSSTDGGLSIGLSLNSNQLTTSIASITNSNRLSIGLISATNRPETTFVIAPLVVGDVIRAHTETGADVTADTRVVFRISRIR